MALRRKNNWRKVILIFIVFSVMIYPSCVDDPSYDVAPSFEQYVQSFIDEGAARGLDIDFSDTGLIIQFSNSSTMGSPGACLGNRNIVIGRNIWEHFDAFEKESLIFHELGHCELFREHRNDKLDNREWASLMRGQPFSECENGIFNFAGTRRKYYVDELFDASIPLPDWSLWSSEIAISQSEREVVLEINEASVFDHLLPNLSSGNFEIDLELNTDDMTGFGGFVFMGSSLSTNIRIFTNKEKDIAIDSGGEVWGFMHLEQKSPLLNAGFNRITIQRKSQYYYVFVNGQFYYWFDFLQPGSDEISSANIGSSGEPEFRNILVSVIP